ncbi:MAG: CHRD domain-containing protein [Bdellovibrionales bacterium]|nr:CHRD domain-containing protein [Bdellovibrionales bacterium]
MKGWLLLVGQLCFAAVACLMTATSARAETHIVRLYDFYYEPQHLEVTQGDTVRFVWADAFHDAVAGAPPGLEQLSYQFAFQTPIDDGLPFSRDVVFTRDLLINFPAPNNRYDYYCTPHFVSGMVGSITVERTEQAFVARPEGLQVLPALDTAATANCSGTLNGDESELSISCSHTASGVTKAEIRQGFPGENGTTICSLTTGATVTGTCTLTQTQANDLWDGRYYLLITTTAHPEGELRGQLLRAATERTISGRVVRFGGEPLAGVTVYAGDQSALTDDDGVYSITGVSSGIYYLEAMKSGYAIRPDEGVSPAMVNANNPTNRNFTAVPGRIECETDSDGDGVCDEQETIDGSDPTDRGSYRVYLERPIRVLWNGFIGILNIAALLNRSEQAVPVTLRLHDITGAIVHEEQRTLAARGETDIIINDLPGFQAESFGLLTIDVADEHQDAIDGQIFYYRNGQTGDYEFTFGVPFMPPTRGTSAVGFNTFNPSRNPTESQDLVAQWLALVNLDATTTRSFTVRRVDQAGSVLGEQTVAVSPLGRVDLEAGHVFPGPDRVGAHFIVPESDDVPYLAQLYRYGGNAPAGFSPTQYRFAFPLLAKAGSGQPQFAPISRGGGAENWVEVLNTLDEPITASVAVYDTAGTLLSEQSVPLEARAQQHINAGQFLPEGGSGYVRASGSKSGSLVGQSMFYFRDVTSGSVTAMYGSPLREQHGSEVYGSYNLFLGMSNWLKINNTSDSTIVATVSVYPPTGSPNVRMVELAPRAGVDLGLHESQFGTAPDSFGLVQVETNGSALTEVLRLRMTTSGAVDFAAPTPMR